MMINKDKAKELILNHLKHSGSMDSSKEKLKVVIDEIAFCDAIIYNLRSIVRSECSEDIYFPSNEMPSSSSSSSSQGELYPKEVNAFTRLSTGSIKCHNCLGSKSWPCIDCKSKYQEYCEKCTTNPFNIKCDYCYNKKLMSIESCSKCQNKLSIICSTCKGIGELRLYNRKTSFQDCIYDVSVKCKEKSIPLSIILKSKGSLIVDESGSNGKLRPISNFPDSEIYQTSSNFLHRHETKIKNSPNWKLESQHQQLIVIPVAVCTAFYNKKPIHFSITGENHNVHLNDNTTCCSIF